MDNKNHETRVTFAHGFTTRFNEAGTLEVLYNGNLVGDIHNTDSREIVID